MQKQAKVIVLSDLHLQETASAKGGIDTFSRLEAAINRIEAAYVDADLVIFAGDIHDRARMGHSYDEVRKSISRLSVPWTATIGNHDLRSEFLECFGSDFEDENGFAQSVHYVREHVVIVLDSFLESTDPDWPYHCAPWGHLCQQRLDWLQRQLALAAGRPVIVVVHHNVCPVGISVDHMRIENAEQMIDHLVAHGGVRQVISGHIHVTTTTFYRGIPFTTLSGGYTDTVEDFGLATNKFRRKGPAQFAVILSDDRSTTVHFDNYCDQNPIV